MSTEPDVRHGDCIEVMRTMPADSIDAIVTDPPYGLGFMGKAWDALPPGKEWAEECLRVLKPGGHILAFGGSRTWHRLAVAIEDGGFEIKESVAWLYGQGFPKSHNASRALDGKRCGCAIPLNHDNVSREGVPAVPEGMDPERPLSGGAESDLLEGMPKQTTGTNHEGQAGAQRPKGDDPVRGVRTAREDPASMGEEEHEDLLLPTMQRGSAGQRMGNPRAQGQGSEGPLRSEIRGGQPRVEGWSDDAQREGELHWPALHQVPEGVAVDGTGGWLHHGAPPSDGAVGGADTTTNGSGEPHQPEPKGQQAGKPGNVPVERGPQAGGSWPLCSGCGKPKIPDGLGTALKPAFEPIVMGRKPFKSTVAANVLEHGTGALNIDGCRIGNEVVTTHSRGANTAFPKVPGAKTPEEYGRKVDQTPQNVGVERSGRWPANVILDEHTAELLDEQSGIQKDGVSVNRNRDTREETGGYSGGWMKPTADAGYGGSGGASRFFYCAKAPKRERPNVDGTVHTTVKPLTLMRHLIRLVTPAGGTVLDTFAGSGTTLEAAMLEGFNSVGIERETEYLPLIQHRIERAGSTQPMLDIPS